MLVLLSTFLSTGQSDEGINPSPPKFHTENITENHKEYSINMEGNLDFENSSTRHCSNWEVAFQPNISLTVENTGRTLVRNPKIIVNGQRNWGSMEEVLAEALKDAQNEQEKIYLLWDFMRKNRYHDSPVFGHSSANELHDPVKMLNTYAGGLCDDAGSCGSSLYYHAGFNSEKGGKNPFVRCLHGHMMCEVFYDGDYQFMDIDEDVFYLDRENEKPVSGDAVCRDHDLAKRERHYGPIFQGWQTGESAASLFGNDDARTTIIVAGHRMDITLRPGEKLVYSWDNIGKLASEKPDLSRRFYGNSKLIYTPSFELLDLCAESARDVMSVTDGETGIVGSSPDAHIIYNINTPYVICGGEIQAKFSTNAMAPLRPASGRDRERPLYPADTDLTYESTNRFGFSISFDCENWETIWEGTEEAELTLPIDEFLKVHESPPKYQYFIRVELPSASGAKLVALTISTDIMASPLALPRLQLGENNIAYTDETEEPHEVIVTHCWQECANVQPPEAPHQLEYPADKSVVRDSILMFKWQPVPNCKHYHIQVSRHPDMKIPYRPSFDTIVETTKFGIPFTGIFSPDETYYWRLRARDKNGVWSEWSDIWQFSWDGPRVPIDVEKEVQGNRIMISWKPNPRGNRPIYYEVYGSDEKGFSISKEPYEVMGLGKCEANYVGRTTETKMLVVAPDAVGANVNKTFYRVVAVDKNGTESGASDYVEMPHPFVYSIPLTGTAYAKVGENYSCTPKYLASLGDLQHRYEEPHKKFWEKEEYSHELLEAPGWLNLDPKTGTLSGTPTDDDVGTSTVLLKIFNQFGGEVKHSYQLSVRHR